VLAVVAYSMVATFGILKALSLVVPLRIGGKIEGVGLDVAEHGEEAYTDGDGAILVTPGQAAFARTAPDAVALPGGGRL
jgi:Amt family ammonium transporter